MSGYTNHYGISVSSNGGGDGKIFSGKPYLYICDTLFVFDLSTKVFEDLKTFYKEHDVKTTSVLQLERYKDKEDFRNALTQLIRYGIYENQDLCDKLSILSTDAAYTKIANEVWPVEKRAITKFRGREWPTDNFCKEFLPIDGSGSVSPSPEKMDMNNLVSWFFEISHSEYETSDTYSLGSERPTIESLPIPIQPYCEIPSIPYAPSGDSYSVEYSVIYYTWNEVTTFPIVKNIARPFGNIVTSNAIPQNTVTVHVTKQQRVEIHVEVTSSDSGGD